MELKKGFKNLETKTQRLLIGCGLAAFIVGAVTVSGSCIEYYKSKRNSPEIITKDLDNNGKPEVYVEVNGKKYFRVYDGKELMP